MEKRKNLDGVVKNSAEKKKNQTGSPLSPARFSFGKKRFFSGFNFAVSFVLFAVLLLGFWFTFETFALNPPTSNPPSGGGNALSVDGSGTVFVGGGTGKLNAGTIDPVYEILGVKYASYVAGMVGQKEEVTGTVKLQALNSKSETLNNIQNPNLKIQNNLGFSVSDLGFEAAEYAYIMDFDNLEQGSDLWLFRKITDFKQDWSGLSVLLTPDFSGRVWYEKHPSENRLTIFAQPVPTNYNEFQQISDFKVSYRLTAPRFDWRKWGNLVEDQSVPGFKVE